MAIEASSIGKAARNGAAAVWIVLLVWLTSSVVGFAASQGWLIPAALPLPLIPIIGLRLLRPGAERAGWAVFTLWLGATYAGIGTPAELSVFAVIAALSLAGYLVSPWFFVAAWFGHIAWDLAPRELPDRLHDLPAACMIFDGIIGLWLGWLARSRWTETQLPEP